MSDVELLIEDGILLKRYTRPWTPQGHGAAPAGWTPERDEWVLKQADTLQAEKQGLPREIALQAAVIERGEQLNAQRLPWPGWVPITVRNDPKISQAYRQLFIDTNSGINEGNVMAQSAQARATLPPDGRYVLRGKKMEQA